MGLGDIMAALAPAAQGITAGQLGGQQAVIQQQNTQQQLDTQKQAVANQYALGQEQNRLAGRAQDLSLYHTLTTMLADGDWVADEKKNHPLHYRAAVQSQREVAGRLGLPGFPDEEVAPNGTLMPPRLSSLDPTLSIHPTLGGTAPVTPSAPVVGHAGHPPQGPVPTAYGPGGGAEALGLYQSALGDSLLAPSPGGDVITPLLSALRTKSLAAAAPAPAAPTAPAPVGNLADRGSTAPTMDRSALVAALKGATAPPVLPVGGSAGGPLPVGDLAGRVGTLASGMGVQAPGNMAPAGGKPIDLPTLMATVTQAGQNPGSQSPLHDLGRMYQERVTQLTDQGYTLKTAAAVAHDEIASIAGLAGAKSDLTLLGPRKGLIGAQTAGELANAIFGLQRPGIEQSRLSMESLFKMLGLGADLRKADDENTRAGASLGQAKALHATDAEQKEYGQYVDMTKANIAEARQKRSDISTRIAGNEKILTAAGWKVYGGHVITAGPNSAPAQKAFDQIQSDVAALGAMQNTAPILSFDDWKASKGTPGAGQGPVTQDEVAAVNDRIRSGSFDADYRALKAQDPARAARMAHVYQTVKGKPYAHP